jgi:hypothetical protein
MVKARRIIAGSIKDHLIHHISSLSTSKEMMDALTQFFEGNNINRRMTLRTTLKNVRMQNSETIHYYFSRVNQIKEQKEAIGDTVNGVVERKNRMIMEAVKAMIHDQYLPMHPWAKVAKIAMYVQNRSPYKVLENKTPEEMVSREKSEVIHLRIFGCPVFVHVPNEKREKMDPFGKNGIFVGYSDTSKAYMIYILGHWKVEINRDVTFDESAAFRKSK